MSKTKKTNEAPALKEIAESELSKPVGGAIYPIPTIPLPIPTVPTLPSVPSLPACW